MNVLLLGSGGREHAFAWKLSQSPNIKDLWIAPGNAGTAVCGKNIDLSPLDFSGIKEFV
ncbi:MAG: phosphoribosylamine--glycine ligase N-terminal domain-containing protein, partial [Bacteroidales bacterium]